MKEKEIKDFIKEYLKDNLSISLDIESNDFMTTDCTTSKRAKVTLSIDNEEITSDTFYL